MKQVVTIGPGKSELREVEDVKPNDDQILIKTKYVGVCMSEHDAWAEAEAGEAFGHEPFGVIEEVGKNVKGFAVGEKVSGLWGSTLPGSGGMVEYSVADPRVNTIVKIPADSKVRDEELILEPLSCIMSAVSKVKFTVPGTPVCVIGSGYMGCGAISLLKYRGAYVVAIDIRRECLEDAKKYGADEVYLVDEAKAKFLNVDSFLGFEFVMEWGETDESLDLAINLTKECGQLCIGAYHTGGKRLVDIQQLNVKAIECLSVHPREGRLNDLSARNSLDLLVSGKWKFANMPIKIYPANKFDQAQGELRSKYGKYIKALIDMTMEDGEPYIK